MKKSNESERMRILALMVHNLKCISAVEINSFGDILEIRGKTGQGKTAILEAIEGGLRGIDPSMVRNGAGAAEITLRLNRATICRVVPADGSRETLMVSDPITGKPIEKAKDFLKAIYGLHSFRPVDWVRLGGGEARGRTERLRAQRDQLLAAMPLALEPEEVAEEVLGKGAGLREALEEVNLDAMDFSGHALVICSALETACYEYRKLQNSRAEDAESLLKLTLAPERLVESDLETLLASQERGSQVYHRALGQRESRQTITARRDQLEAQIEKDGADLPEKAELAKELKGQKTRRTEIDLEVARKRQEIRELEKESEALVATIGRLEGLEARLEAHEARKAELAEIEQSLGSDVASDEEVAKLEAGMEKVKGLIRDRQLQEAHDAAAEKAMVARQKSERYDALVKLFRDELPKKLIGRMAMPVEGLAVDGDVIKIDGIPLHQLGTSEQMRVGVLIWASLNPHTAFVPVDGAESMGREDRLALAQAAQELGLQLIMTIVDDAAEPGEGRIVMRNGEAA